MSQETENCVTDSNVVQEQVNVVNDDSPAQPNEQREKVNYEVVFFARYHSSQRPSSEDVTAYFNRYGTVHHVNCPQDSNYAFIFMSSLNTTAERRRTRATISQIINDMTPENKFHITVASSNRGAYSQNYNRPKQQNYNENRQYDNRQHDNRQYDNRQYDNRGYGRQYRPMRYDNQNGYINDNQQYNNSANRMNGMNNEYQRRPYMRNAGPNDTYNRDRPMRRPYTSGSYSAEPYYKPRDSYTMNNLENQTSLRRPYQNSNTTSNQVWQPKNSRPQRNN